ncbi:MAG: hypothetical protein ACR2PK_06945 [Acidimicrobiales bacterium]
MTDNPTDPSSGRRDLKTIEVAVAGALAEGEVIEDLLHTMLGPEATPQHLQRRGMEPFKATYTKWHGLWRARRANARSTSVPAHQVDAAMCAATDFSQALSSLEPSVSIGAHPEVVLVAPPTDAVHKEWAHRLDDRQAIGPIYNEVRSALGTLAAAQARLRLIRSRTTPPSQSTDQ